MASETMQNVYRGKEIAQVAVQTVKSVHTSTTDLAGIVDQLNSKVVENKSVVNVIKDIADQTNLLALNSAIEAERAGAQGNHLIPQKHASSRRGGH